MQPKVSVIVPIYNTENYLHRCIDSILAQTFTDFELILVDDGSSDSSGRICDEYAKKDCRIHAYHKINEGAGFTRKYGVEKAQSKWILFVDSDDTIPEKAIENLIYDSNDGKYDLVIGTFITDKGYTYKHKITGIIDNKEYIKALLADITMIGPVVKLYKKSFFDKCLWNIDKKIIQNEDLLMLVDYAAHINQVYISNQNICYKQHIRKDSVSQSLKMSSIGWLLLFDRLDEIIDSIKTKNNDIKINLYKYKLRRIYIRIFRNRLKIDTSTNTIKKILAEENKYKNKLIIIEKETLDLLKSKLKRNFFYIKLKIIAIIKEITNKLGLLNIYYKIKSK